MYGLMNKGVEDLALAVGGGETWQRIKEEAGVDVVAFVSMDPYPDEVTHALIGAASKVLRRPAADILRALGRHWILYTAREGYGPLLDSAGATLGELLSNLDMVHARAGLAVPHLRPPSFVVEEPGGGTYVVRYVSERTGFAPMVVGLLEGAGERFGYEVRVTHRVTRDEAGHDEFVVEVAGALAAAPEAVHR